MTPCAGKLESTALTSVSRRMHDRTYAHWAFSMYNYWRFDKLNRSTWGQVAKRVYTDLYVHGRP